ncbi:MAG: hypothetical protein ACKVOQ_04720 [Cyclobacteriaceae bacterium]
MLRNYSTGIHISFCCYRSPNLKSEIIDKNGDDNKMLARQPTLTLAAIPDVEMLVKNTNIGDGIWAN